MAILTNFPFDVIRVDFWFVETNKLDREAFSKFMSSKQYHCHHVDRVNTLCRLKEEAQEGHKWRDHVPGAPALGPL